MKPNIVTVLLLIFFFPLVSAQTDLKDPSFEEVLSIKSVGNPTISHNGKHVAFTVRRTDWENNRYDTEIWLSKNGNDPFQLTRTKDGSSSNPQWSPDDKWLAFTANRGNKNQIHVIRLDGGEASILPPRRQ